MKTICLYFEIHNIIHLRRYRFFDIGSDHYYYDDYTNETSLNDIVERCYAPALSALLDMIESSNKTFKVAFAVSGVALEQLEMYAPSVIDLLQDLNKTGCVEFLAEPYSHGLSSFIHEETFRDEVKRHANKMEELFGRKPTIFRNSGLTYSDDIANLVADLGYKAMLTEGAKQILGWKSPHFVYHSGARPDLKLLLRDFKLSDDISLRFSNTAWSEYPLYADRYLDWIDQLPEDEKVINLFMDLKTIGIFQPLYSNIIEFFKALPAAAAARNIEFATPAEVIEKHSSQGGLSSAYPVSWNDEERDTSSWLGNVMQREAFRKLYSVADRVLMCNDRHIKQDWDYLQASNNFRFMSTKNTGLGVYRGIYDSAYDAFTNYMNIISDFINRVDALFPEELGTEELNALITTIQNQGEEIAQLHDEIGKWEMKYGKLSKVKSKAAARRVKKQQISGNEPL
ncbi:Alpha-amylase [Bacteroides coprosuis DSM 18011]|uniref:Alpha-amylase n=1 Tax=Bacteroides coprosuis DSM 18011 TaxID=679937 RepID=F3ZTK8_9BACE|nr:glycoside hydrolase family 57 protein [Bacteroides coprosuis]EGJ71239.1 Alpha-amylase [Bacteroides coprosuis DSM 18011]